MKNKVIRIIFFLFLVILLILGIFAYDYITVNYNLSIPCIIHKCFGVYCPGCGLTRAANALLRLNFYEAFRYNTLSIVLLPALFVFLVVVIWQFVFKRKDFAVKLNIFYLVIFAGILVIYGVLRNILPWLKPY